MATDILTPILTAMLDTAATAVAPTGRQIIAPGVPAWDDCCSGQVWVRLVSLVPGSAIAGQAQYRSTVSVPCGVLNWLATFGVGVIRCAHSVDDRGNAPSAALVTADATEQVADMLDLSEAIQCDMTQITNVERLTMVRWDSLGPDGGCVGGEWIFTTLLDNCRC